MRLLVLSDVHANLEALEACLAAVPSYDRVINLGDVVGYNASPNEVCKRVRELGGPVVRGNHDRACTGQMDVSEFNLVAAMSARWTQNTLSDENLEWLRGLPQGPVHPEGVPRVEAVHGAPRDEDEYLLNLAGADANLRIPEPCDRVFYGHTHLQGGFVQQDGVTRSFVPRYDSLSGIVHYRLPLDSASRYLINPGSVGQPRDNDPRAAFAVYESSEDGTEAVIFYRAPYDIQQAQQRIFAAHLPERLALRLAVGR